jgi:hypothetical protein
MQSNFYMPQCQSLTKKPAMDIMEINTIGLRLFTSCGALKKTVPYEREFTE